MKERNITELRTEIDRVNVALLKTDSYKLRNDYRKYLRRLHKELHRKEREKA